MVKKVKKVTTTFNFSYKIKVIFVSLVTNGYVEGNAKLLSFFVYVMPCTRHSVEVSESGC